MAKNDDPTYRPAPKYEARIKKMCERLVPVIREAARTCGYAIGVHGSMVRDLDLIAAPWVEEATDAPTMVEAVMKALRVELGEDSIYGGFQPKMPSPHGRLWASITLASEVGVRNNAGVHPFIDLSIMPIHPMKKTVGTVIDFEKGLDMREGWPFGTEISAETQKALDEIDDNIRAAHAAAPHIFLR